MVGKSSLHTLDDYVQGIRLLLSCVTRYVAVPINRDSQNYVTINYGNHVALGVSSRFSLEYQQNYTVDESGIETSGYIYTVFDNRTQQVLNYHWHPGGRSHIVTPHLHLKQGARVGLPEVRDAHLPTGYVTLSAFLEFLIRDFGVAPLRDDWQSILSANTDL